MADKEMLSSGKIAEELGVSAAKVKKAIEKAGVEPDDKKGRCAYYSRETFAKIKKELS